MLARGTLADAMLLLTGATGMLGSTLLPRLTAAGIPVRCLVRDPRRLGPERVRVQIALGDLADPPSFRHALRGVQTVVHLAATVRDQPGGSIEELGGIATWRMVEAAERAGAERFVFSSALGATAHDRTRLLRSKALAEDAVAGSRLTTTIIACSLLHAPGAGLVRMLERLSLLPVVPLVGHGRALVQPLWAQDAADCIAECLRREPRVRHERFELAGPETLSYAALTRIVTGALGRRRPLVPVPEGLVRGALRTSELLLDGRAPVTWDEAEMATVSLTTPRGAADARMLGVEPRRLVSVLGAG